MAGAAALIVAIPAVLASLPPGSDRLAFFALESAKGVWLGWSAIAVIAAGIFFHQATDTRAEKAAPLTPRSLFVIAYLLGGFIETAVGFGVSFVVVVSALRRSGFAPLPAILLGLFGHLFVPWGALATGTMIGAELAGEPLQLLGLHSAMLMAPIAILSLPFYWACLKMGGVQTTLADRLDDVVWLAAILSALTAAHFIVPTQMAAIAALGLLLILRRLRDGPLNAAALKRDIQRSAHHIVLCVSLLASRLIPPLRDWLEQAFVIQPFADAPAYAPLYNPSAFLIVVGAAFGVARNHDLRAVAMTTISNGWRALLVTAMFVTLARWLTASGIAESLADALIGATGPQGVALAPLLGGLAGFLTGSNVASNAMMMPIQSALDSGGRLAPGMLAAMQNVSGSMLTSLSPIRISMARALAGAPIREGEIYAAAWPFGAITLTTLLAIAGWAVLVF